MMLLAGIVIRGRYTFEMTLKFPTRLFPHSDTAAAKNCHGINAQKTKIG